MRCGASARAATGQSHVKRDEALLVGVLSDTHGLMRREALTALAGCDHILHAGDVGDESVLAALTALAPVTAVRGNTDNSAWALRLPETAFLRLGGVTVFLTHDRQRLRFDPAEDGIDAVVCGHTHAALNEVRAGVLHFNPGSAGPRRFDRPATIGRLRIRGQRATGEIVALRIR
jgi:putative phosphoesterase